MRGSRISRWVGRAAFVLMVGVGASGIAATAAQAEASWETVNREGATAASSRPVVTNTTVQREASWE